MKALKHKIWVESDGEMFLGNGRVKLLQAIAEKGSITAAAKSMKMSYKKAWEQIDQMNTLSNDTLVETSAGGAGGGGAIVTDLGQELIANFNKANRACLALLNSLDSTIKFDSKA